MGFLDKLRKKQKQEQEYEDVSIEEEEVQEEKKRNLFGGDVIKWGGFLWVRRRRYSC